MKTYLNKLKAYAKAPVEDVQFILRVKKYGYHEIMTEFEYEHTDDGVLKHSFRTIIQLDADILNFIPDYIYYYDDQNWRAIFEQHYQIHKQKIEDFAFSLSAHSQAWNQVIDGGLFMGALYPFYDLIANFNPENGYEALFYGVAAALFRKYAKSKLISVLTSKAFALVKWYFERKAKKNEKK